MALLVGDVVTNFVAKIDDVSKAVSGIQNRLDKLSKQTFKVKLGADDTKVVRAIQRIDVNMARLRQTADKLSAAFTALTAGAAKKVIAATAATQGAFGKSAARTKKTLASIGAAGKQTGNFLTIAFRNSVQAFLDWSGVLTLAAVSLIPNFIKTTAKATATTAEAATQVDKLAASTSAAGDIAATAAGNVKDGAAILTETSDIMTFLNQNVNGLVIGFGAFVDVVSDAFITLASFGEFIGSTLNTVFEGLGNALNFVGSSLEFVLSPLVRLIGFGAQANEQGQRAVTLLDLIVPRLAVLGTFSLGLLGINFILRSIVGRIRTFAASRPESILGRLSSLINTIFLAINNIVSPVTVIANRLASILGIVTVLTSAVISISAGVTTLFTGIQATFGLFAIFTPLVTNLFLRLRTSIVQIAAGLGSGRARFIIFFNEVKEAIGTVAKEINNLRKIFGRRFNFVAFFLQAVVSIRESLQFMAKLGVALVNLLLDGTKLVTESAIQVGKMTLDFREWPNLFNQLAGTSSLISANFLQQKSAAADMFEKLGAIANNFWPTILGIGSNILRSPFLLIRQAATGAFNQIKVTVLGFAKVASKTIAERLSAVWNKVLPSSVAGFFSFLGRTAKTIVAPFTTPTKKLAERFREIWRPNQQALDAQFQSAEKRIGQLDRVREESQNRRKRLIRDEERAQEQFTAKAKTLATEAESAQDKYNAAIKEANQELAKTEQELLGLKSQIAGQKELTTTVEETAAARSREFQLLQGIREARSEGRRAQLERELLALQGSNIEGLKQIQSLEDKRRKAQARLVDLISKRREAEQALTAEQEKQVAAQRRAADAEQKRARQSERLQHVRSAIERLTEAQKELNAATEGTKTTAVTKFKAVLAEVKTEVQALGGRFQDFGKNAPNAFGKVQQFAQDSLSTLTKSSAGFATAFKTAEEAANKESAALQKVNVDVERLTGEFNKATTAVDKQRQKVTEAEDAFNKLGGRSKAINDLAEAQLEAARSANQLAQSEKKQQRTALSDLETDQLRLASKRTRLQLEQQALLEALSNELQVIDRRRQALQEDAAAAGKLTQQNIDNINKRADAEEAAVKREVEALRFRQKQLAATVAASTARGQTPRLAGASAEFRRAVQQEFKRTPVVAKDAADKIRQDFVSSAQQTVTTIDSLTNEQFSKIKAQGTAVAEDIGEQFRIAAREFAKASPALASRARGGSQTAQALRQTIEQLDITGFLERQTTTALGTVGRLVDGFFAQSKSKFEREFVPEINKAFNKFNVSGKVREEFANFLAILAETRTNVETVARRVNEQLETFGLRSARNVSKPLATLQQAVFQLAQMLRTGTAGDVEKGIDEFLTKFTSGFSKKTAQEKAKIRKAFIEMLTPLADIMPSSAPKDKDSPFFIAGWDRGPKALPQVGEQIKKGRPAFENQINDAFRGIGDTTGVILDQELDKATATAVPSFATKFANALSNTFSFQLLDIVERLGFRQLDNVLQIDRFSEKLKGADSAITKFGESFAQTIERVGVLRPLVSALGRGMDFLAAKLALAVTDFDKFVAGIIGASDETGRWVKSLLGASGALGLLVLALNPATNATAALAALIGTLSGGLFALLPVLTETARTVTGVVNTSFGLTRALTGLLGFLVTFRREKLAEAIRGTTQAIKGLFQVITGTGLAVAAVFKAVIQTGRGLITSVKLTAATLEATGRLILGTFAPLAGFVRTALGAVVEAARLPLGQLLDLFTNSAIAAGRAFFKGLVFALDPRRFLAGAGRLILNAGKAIIGLFTKGIRDDKNKPREAVEDAEKEIEKVIPSSPPKEGPLAGNRLVKAGMTMMSLMGEGIREGSGFLVTAFSGALNILKGSIQTSRGLGEIFTGLFQAARLNPAGLVKVFKGVFNTLTGLFKVGGGIISPLFNAGRLITTALGRGITAARGLLFRSTAKTLDEGVKKLVPQSPPLAGPLAGNFLTDAGGKMIEMMSAGVLKQGGVLNTAVSTVLSGAFLPVFGPASLILSGAKAIIGVIKSIGSQLTNLASNPAIAALKGIGDQVLQVGLTAERFAPSDEAADEFIGKFDAFARAVKPLGVEASRVETIFVTLERTLSDAVSEPLGEAAAKFQRLGVDLTAFAGGEEDIIDVTLRLADQIKSGTLEAEELQDAFELTAATFGPLKNLLLRGGEEIREGMMRASEVGTLIDGEAVDKAIEFNKQIDEFEFALEGIKRTIFTEIVPVFNDFLMDVQDWWVRNKESVITGVKILSGIFAVLFDIVIKKIGEWSQSSQKFTKDLGAILSFLIRTVITFFNSIFNQTAAIGKIAGDLINNVVIPLFGATADFVINVIFPKLAGAFIRLVNEGAQALGSNFLRVIFNIQGVIVEAINAAQLAARAVGAFEGPTIREEQSNTLRELTKGLRTIEEAQIKVANRQAQRRRIISTQEQIIARRRQKLEGELSDEERARIEENIELREIRLGQLREAIAEEADLEERLSRSVEDSRKKIAQARSALGLEFDASVFTKNANDLAEKLEDSSERAAERLGRDIPVLFESVVRSTAQSAADLGKVALEALEDFGPEFKELLGTLVEDLEIEDEAAEIEDKLSQLQALLAQAAVQAETAEQRESVANVQRQLNAVQRSFQVNEALLIQFSKKVEELRRKSGEILGLDILDLEDFKRARQIALAELDQEIEKLKKTQEDLVRQRDSLASFRGEETTAQFIQRIQSIERLGEAIEANERSLADLNDQLMLTRKLADQSDNIRTWEKLAETFTNAETELGKLISKEVDFNKQQVELAQNLAVVEAKLGEELATGVEGPVLSSLKLFKDKAIETGGEVGAQIKKLFDQFLAFRAAGAIEDAAVTAAEIFRVIKEASDKAQEEAADTRFDELASTLADKVRDSLTEAIKEFNENEGKVQVGRLFNNLMKSISEALVTNLINDMTKQLTESLKTGLKEVFSFAGEQAGVLATAATAAIAVVLQFLSKQSENDIAVAKEGLQSVVEETERVRGIISGESTIKLKEVADNLREALMPTNDILRRIEFNTRVGLAASPATPLAQAVGGS